MAKVTGIVQVEIDGVIEETNKGSSKLEVGGKTRKPVITSSGVHFTEEIKEAKLSVEFVHKQGVDATKYNAITNATIRVICDSGQVYVMHEAFALTDGTVNEQEGKLPMEFSSKPALLEA